MKIQKQKIRKNGGINMSVRQLLGLENAGISEDEVIAKLREAYARNLDSVDFSVRGHAVRIRLPHVNPESIMGDFG